MSQMKHRPAESDQLIIVMDGCVPLLSRKLRDLGIRNFEEFHRFGVHNELDLAQEKKFFSKRSIGKEGTGSSSGIRPSISVQINAIG